MLPRQDVAFQFTTITLKSKCPADLEKKLHVFRHQHLLFRLFELVMFVEPIIGQHILEIVRKFEVFQDVICFKIDDNGDGILI